MHKKTMNLQAPLAQEIQKAYQALSKAIDTSEMTDEVQDIIAYQIGWGQLLIGWYQAGIEQRSPEMPGEGFTTWDYTGLARHFHKKYRLDPSQQKKLLDETVRRIVDFVEKEYQAGHLDTCGVWEWCILKSGKQWPLSKWVRVNTVAPYKRAVVELRKLLK